MTYIHRLVKSYPIDPDGDYSTSDDFLGQNTLANIHLLHDATAENISV
jgi:hypothetical protein